MKIENRTFIVSGGSSGLGLASVHDFLSKGAYLVVLDQSPLPSNENFSASRVKFLKVDITNVKEIEDAVEASVTWTKQTGAALGGVINCAGVGVAGKIIDSKNEPHSLELWDFVLAVNLTGTFNLTRLALKHLVHVPPVGPDGERGVIVLVSSAAAFEGQPGQTAYAATKGALRSMALPMARDLARHGIRVVSVAPGAFETSMTASLPTKAQKSLIGEGVVFPRRFGRAEEFAETVRWVVECGYVNGETVRLSGAGRLPAKL
jgi:NAD(P)-dependent dehydrogenase (short-subunit alcohol dehydrogenase family)